MTDELINPITESTPAPESITTPPVAPVAPVVENKTETRGRHKKDCTCERCLAKKGIASPASTASSAGSFESGRSISDSNPLNLDEFKKVEGVNQSSAPEQVNAGKFITGGLLLICIDALMPATIIKVLSIFDKDLKTIKTKEIKLSSEQIEDLEPLANEAVKGIVMTMSPMSAFMTAMLMVYAGNTMSAVMDRKETPKPEKK
jgi:hypothetical protein